MPLLNGIKVACEPCIRGHRSTKCNHANERLMVPVRKPGRPLSTCPHATNQPCNCGHVTAAIPRKQTCHCPDDVPGATEAPPSNDVFGDLPSPTRSSYRVQKSSSRPPSSRKASSFDSSAFDRMNLGDFNVMDSKSLVNQGVVSQNPPFGNTGHIINPVHIPRPSYIPNILDPRVVRDVTAVSAEHIPAEVANNIVVNQRTFPSGDVIFHGNWGLPLTLAEKIAGTTKEGRPFPSAEEIGDIYPRTDLPLDMANDSSYRLYILNDPEKGGNGPKIPYHGTRVAQNDISKEDVHRPVNGLTRFSAVPPSHSQINGTSSNNTVKSCCATKKESRSHNSSSASSISEPQDQPSCGNDFTPQVASEDSKVGLEIPPNSFPDMSLHGTPSDFLGREAAAAAKHSVMSTDFIARRHPPGFYPAGGHNYAAQHPLATGPNSPPHQSYPGANIAPQHSYATTPDHSSQPSYVATTVPRQSYANPTKTTTQQSFAGVTAPSTTLFTYPHTYGSYQNPFKPDTYRQNLQLNNSIPQGESAINPASFRLPLNQNQAATIHECCCGDGCECLGCAAHPYNSATQEYVRSAWTYEPSATAHDFNNISPIAASRNGLYSQHPPSGFDEFAGAQSVMSPTSSANGEEQNLSSADFFFVDYPMGDGCGGDTVSCPCGDDCQCFGCTIHKPGAETQNQPTGVGQSSCCS